MRLIDANALEKTMYSVADLSCSENIHVDVIADIIGNAPTVDAVEVVRCKDCKYSNMTVNGECKYCDIWFPDEAEYMDGDYYCASGERKDGDGNG